MDLKADEFLEANVKLRTNLGEGCIIQLTQNKMFNFPSRLCFEQRKDLVVIPA